MWLVCLVVCFGLKVAEYAECNPSYSPQVCVRIKQYKDELLAACLTFVLSLHPDMVALDMRAYIPALQVRTEHNHSSYHHFSVGVSADDDVVVG